MLGAMGPRLVGAAIVGLPAGALVLMALLAPEGTTLASALEQIGATVCHADPQRSFAGVPVCHRCSGIYGGLALGGLLALVAPRVPFERGAWWALAIGPLAAQIALGLLVPAADQWWLRLATGLAFGALTALAVAHAIAALARRSTVAGAAGRPS
jgi:uncharacterized membrane protein